MEIKRKDLDKYFIIFYIMFIVFIRQGAEYFIGRIAWYAKPLMYLSLAFSLVLFIKYCPRLRGKWNHCMVLSVLCIAIQLLWKNYDIINGNYQRVSFAFATFLLFLVFCNIETSRWAGFLLKCMIFVGVFYSFWTVASYLSPSLYRSLYSVLRKFSSVDLWGYYSKGYISGLTTHWTTNGIYTTTGLIPVACAAFFYSGKKKEKRLLYLLFFLTAVALLLSAKRAHTVFSVVAIFATYYLYQADKPKTRLIRILFVVASAVALFFVVANFIPGVMNVVNRFIEYSDKGDLLNGRENLQAGIYQYIQSSPLWGHGWVFFPYNNTAWRGQYAHNVYLQLLCDTGIIGFAVYISFFSYCIFESAVTLVKIRKKREGYRVSSLEEWVLCSSVCYQIFFLLYCVTGNPLYDSNCFFPYFMMCAASISVINRIKREKQDLILG